VEVHPGSQPSDRDRVDGERGDDRLVTRDGRGTDTVTCGPGRDHVWLDGSDRVTDPRACEQFTYARRK
jgi:hypothetical protein